MPPNSSPGPGPADFRRPQPLPHDSARLHVHGSATYIDDIREQDGTLHVAIGMATRPAASSRALISARARCSRRRRGADGGRRARQERHRAGLRRRAALRRSRSCSTGSRCLPSSPAPATRRGAPRARDDRHRGRAAVRHHRRRARTQRVQDDYDFARGDADAAMTRPPTGWRASSPSAARSISISRARRRSPFPARATR